MNEKYLFRVPQKAVLKKGNKYLVLKRSSNAKRYPSLWDLPGGKLEHGEEINAGLEREVFEETQLKIKVNSPLFVYLENFVCLEKSVQAVVVVFDCDLISGEIKLSEEHTEHRWCSKDEALKLPLEPFLVSFFSQASIK